MSRQDPGAATGQLPHPPSRCQCRHLSTLHAINTRGMRAACTKRGQNPCTCRLFVNAEAVN